MANWSQLLPELLVEIAKSIAVYEDFISFGNVCQSWASAAQTIRSTFTAPSRFPSLMLAEDDEDNGNFRRFYVLSNRFIQKIEFPEANKKQCFASRGWLLTIADNHTDVKLLEPFTRKQIDLPSLNTLPDYAFHRESLDFPSILFKVVLSAQPSSDLNFFVFIIYGSRNQLAFCKPGHASWTATTEEWRSPFYDFTYHNGRVYLVDYSGRIVVCDIHGLNLTNFVCITGNPTEFTVVPGYNDIECLYILGYDDDKLLVVSREGFEPDDESEYQKEDPDYGTKAFRVFELDLNDCKWTKLETLGDRAVFLGFNSGFLIEASEDGIIKANCIYFTDDRSELYLLSTKGGGKDMGIYSLCDGSIEPYFSQESRSLLTPPVWIESSL